MNKRVARPGDGHAVWEKSLGCVSVLSAADTKDDKSCLNACLAEVMRTRGAAGSLNKRVARPGDGHAEWEKSLDCVSDQVLLALT